MRERRQYVRLDHPVRVRYHLKGEPAKKNGTFSRNIGATGACLRMNESLPTGSLLKVVLEIPGRARPLTTDAELMWIESTAEVEEHEGAGFEAGMKFTSLSNADKAVLINFVCESLQRLSHTPPSAQ